MGNLLCGSEERLKVVSKLMVTRRVSEGTSEGPLDERINLSWQLEYHNCDSLTYVSGYDLMLPGDFDTASRD
jgi:hypothetical protein